MDLNSGMYINGEYLKNNPTWDEEDAAWKAGQIHQLLVRNKIQPAQITEIGCGAGGILENLSSVLPQVKDLRGYDISPQAIEIAQKRQTDRLKFFQDDLLSVDETAECVLMIDVVEHVADYYGFMEKLKSKGRVFVFHIPLDASCHSLLKPQTMKQQREAVGHLHYFSEEMVWWFLKDTKFEVIDWMYTKPIPDIQKKSRSFKQAIKKRLRNLSFAINPSKSVKLWGGYSLMILAK